MITQIIRSFSNTTKNIIKKPINKLNIVTQNLNIHNEDDYNTIQSIIHSYSGSIYYNNKDGKFYFKNEKPHISNKSNEGPVDLVLLLIGTIL